MTQTDYTLLYQKNYNRELIRTCKLHKYLAKNEQTKTTQKMKKHKTQKQQINKKNTNTINTKQMKHKMNKQSKKLNNQNRLTHKNTHYLEQIFQRDIKKKLKTLKKHMKK